MQCMMARPNRGFLMEKQACSICQSENCRCDELIDQLIELVKNQHRDNMKSTIDKALNQLFSEEEQPTREEKWI